MSPQWEAAMVTDEQFDLMVEALRAQKELLEKLIVEVQKLQGRDHATVVFTTMLCRVLSGRGVISGDDLAVFVERLIAEAGTAGNAGIDRYAREHLKTILGMLRQDRNIDRSRPQ
jgi:hypothetical protein